MRHNVEKTPLGPWLTDMAKQAREQLATDTFDPEKVREACTKAAKDGFNACVITPPQPLNLKGTAAVEKLEIWLKREGTRFDWVLSGVAKDGTSYPLLQISW